MKLERSFLVSRLDNPMIETNVIDVLCQRDDWSPQTENGDPLQRAPDEIEIRFSLDYADLAKKVESRLSLT